MVERERNLKVGLFFNLLIVALEVVGMILSIRAYQWKLIQFYTQDSNLVALVACGAMAVAQGRCLRNRERGIPNWVIQLKYVAACMVTVTFLVVLFVLAPLYGGGRAYASMFLQGTMLYHHLLCPVLVVLSFLWVERADPIPAKMAGIALVPTALYGGIAIVLNLLHLMRGPYPFLMVHQQPVYMSVLWVVIILGGAYVVAWGVGWLKNRIGRRGSRDPIPAGGMKPPSHGGEK